MRLIKRGTGSDDLFSGFTGGKHNRLNSENMVGNIQIDHEKKASGLNSLFQEFDHIKNKELELGKKVVGDNKDEHVIVNKKGFFMLNAEEDFELKTNTVVEGMALFLGAKMFKNKAKVAKRGSETTGLGLEVKLQAFQDKIKEERKKRQDELNISRKFTQKMKMAVESKKKQRENEMEMVSTNTFNSIRKSKRESQILGISDQTLLKLMKEKLQNVKNENSKMNQTNVDKSKQHMTNSRNIERDYTNEETLRVPEKKSGFTSNDKYRKQSTKIDKKKTRSNIEHMSSGSSASHKTKKSTRSGVVPEAKNTTVKKSQIDVDDDKIRSKIETKVTRSKTRKPSKNDFKIMSQDKFDSLMKRHSKEKRAKSKKVVGKNEIEIIDVDKGNQKVQIQELQLTSKKTEHKSALKQKRENSVDSNSEELILPVKSSTEKPRTVTNAKSNMDSLNLNSTGIIKNRGIQRQETKSRHQGKSSKIEKQKTRKVKDSTIKTSDISNKRQDNLNGSQDRIEIVYRPNVRTKSQNEKSSKIEIGGQSQNTRNDKSHQTSRHQKTNMKSSDSSRRTHASKNSRMPRQEEKSRRSSKSKDKLNETVISVNNKKSKISNIENLKETRENQGSVNENDSHQKSAQSKKMKIIISPPKDKKVSNIQESTRLSEKFKNNRQKYIAQMKKQLSGSFSVKNNETLVMPINKQRSEVITNPSKQLEDRSEQMKSEVIINSQSDTQIRLPNSKNVTNQNTIQKSLQVSQKSRHVGRSKKSTHIIEIDDEENSPLPSTLTNKIVPVVLKTEETKKIEIKIPKIELKLLSKIDEKETNSLNPVETLNNKTQSTGRRQKLNIQIEDDDNVTIAISSRRTKLQQKKSIEPDIKPNNSSFHPFPKSLNSNIVLSGQTENSEVIKKIEDNGVKNGVLLGNINQPELLPLKHSYTNKMKEALSKIVQSKRQIKPMKSDVFGNTVNPIKSTGKMDNFGKELSVHKITSRSINDDNQIQTNKMNETLIQKEQDTISSKAPVQSTDHLQLILSKTNSKFDRTDSNSRSSSVDRESTRSSNGKLNKQYTKSKTRHIRNSSNGQMNSTLSQIPSQANTKSSENFRPINIVWDRSLLMKTLKDMGMEDKFKMIHALIFRVDQALKKYIHVAKSSGSKLTIPKGFAGCRTKRTPLFERDTFQSDITLEADLMIFLVAEKKNTNTLASAATCAHNSANRSYVGRMFLNMEYLQLGQGSYYSQYSETMTVFHEVLHILAFHPDLYTHLLKNVLGNNVPSEFTNLNMMRHLQEEPLLKDAHWNPMYLSNDLMSPIERSDATLTIFTLEYMDLVSSEIKTDREALPNNFVLDEISDFKHYFSYKCSLSEQRAKYSNFCSYQEQRKKNFSCDRSRLFKANCGSTQMKNGCYERTVNSKYICANPYTDTKDIHLFETYGESSRCFDGVSKSGAVKALCLEFEINETGVLVKSEGREYQCTKPGETVFMTADKGSSRYSMGFNCPEPTEFARLYKLTNCPNSCHANGFCADGRCLCFNGFSASDHCKSKVISSNSTRFASALLRG